MDTAFLPRATLVELYRFAWLLAGEAKAAERTLQAALEGLAPQLEQIRSANSRNVWLVRRIRQTSMAHLKSQGAAPAAETAPRLLRAEAFEMPEILEIEAYIVAQHIHRLPEPDRTALALFYLDLVAPPDVAQLLGLTLEQYCAVIGRARVKLGEAMRTTRDPSATPAVELTPAAQQAAASVATTAPAETSGAV